MPNSPVFRRTISARRAAIGYLTALSLLTGVAPILLATQAGCQRNPDRSIGGGMEIPITLEIDFANRTETKTLQLRVPDGATVLDALQVAQANGQIAFAFIGSGETAFVTEIDSIQNKNAPGHNWVYRVNGKLGDRSCGVFALQANDSVQWRLGSYP